MCQNSTPSCPSLLLRLRGYDVDLQAVQTNDEDEAAVAENDGDIHATYDLISNFCLEQTDAEDDTTRADVDGLRIRALPKILTKPVEQLSPAQRQTVKDIGLGRLLDLQITNLSRQMGLWLVENFDPRSCTLQLQNGQTIHITVDDVAAVLGLPKGHIEITKRTTKALPEILKEWRWIFEKTIAYITPKALTRKMIEVDAADPWFKRHFALLVMSALIDPMVNGENAPPEEGNPSILVSDVPQPPQPPQPQKEDNPMPEGLQNTPTAILEDDRFKKMFESARQLLGFKAQEDQQLTFSHQEDAFWGDPEFLNTVDEIVRAVQKRTYLNDVPSFSLGLTQEEQTRRWDDVSVVAREYNECE
nr:uncharacterized protein LOC109191529 [Ipomoea batatas]